jgi:ribosomal-protein-alanine N-acetyltransferase
MSHKFELIKGQTAFTSDLALALFHLDQNYFPTPWTRDSWLDLFNEHERLLVTLKNAEGQLIGFCLFDLSHADSFAHLLKILIVPEERAKKYSKPLLEKAMSALKAETFSQFFLEVEADNYAAQKLYLSCGMKVIHRKKDFYGQGRDALIMT